MTLHLWLMDLANYSAQIAAVIAVGSVAPLLLRVRKPEVMLIYRHLLLAACLLLPLLQPWRRPVVDDSAGVSISTGSFSTTAPDRRNLNTGQAAAMLLIAGIVARLAWLGIGLCRLSRYRRRAIALTATPAVFEALANRLGVRPSICLSTDVSSPVTFGILRPAILLPPSFLAMPPATQQAIACHELTHVRRRDWAAAMIEELIRALLWFHP